jgi:hypothetical protein
VCDVENRQRSFEVLAIAFGDIERERRGSPVQLILDLPGAGSRFQQAREPAYEGDGFLVDLQLFMIEPMFAGIGHVHQFLILILLVIFIFFLFLILLLLILPPSCRESPAGVEHEQEQD